MFGSFGSSTNIIAKYVSKIAYYNIDSVVTAYQIFWCKFLNTSQALLFKSYVKLVSPFGINELICQHDNNKHTN